MAKLGKREKENNSKVEAQKFYSINEALELVKALANAKFDESVDVAVQLGIDPRKSDQAVRGAVVMPAGTGKTVRVAVFAAGPMLSVWKTLLLPLKVVISTSTLLLLNQVLCALSVS